MTETVPRSGLGTKTVPSGAAAIRWAPGLRGMVRATAEEPFGITVSFSCRWSKAGPSTNKVPSADNAMPAGQIPVVRVLAGLLAPAERTLTHPRAE